ncbi:hypothetical protein [Thermococcus sp.]
MMISYANGQLKSSEDLKDFESGMRILIRGGPSQRDAMYININVIQNTIGIPSAMGNVDSKMIAEILGNANRIENLFSLLQRLRRKYPNLGPPKVEIFIDPSDSSLRFIEIVFPEGTWEEWKQVSKEVKNELRERGQIDLASKVAIVCLKGMEE